MYRWRERTAVIRYKSIVVRLQAFGGLFFPNYFSVFLRVRNKSKQSVISIKSERPHAVVHNNRQIRFREEGRSERCRSHCQSYWGARHRECLGWSQVIFWRSNYLEQRVLGRRVSLSALRHPGSPQETRGHDIGHLRVSVVRNDEAR